MHRRVRSFFASPFADGEDELQQPVLRCRRQVSHHAEVEQRQAALICDGEGASKADACRAFVRESCNEQIRR